MDLPDAKSVDRNRGLPLDPSPPSVRLYIASGPVRDPTQRDRSVCALVESSDYESEYLSSPLPARSGTQLLTSTQGETTNGALSPQLSANVGLCSSSVSDRLQMERCLRDNDEHAMSLRSDHTMMYGSDDASVVTQYRATQQSLNVRHS